MEGDEDWVSTSPIKLQAPPARRAFTPGRVLSREEIRQQRRRGPAPAIDVDHPLALSHVRESSVTSLLGEGPAKHTSASRTSASSNTWSSTTRPVGSQQHQSKQPSHASSPRYRNQTLASLAHQIQASPKQINSPRDTRVEKPGLKPDTPGKTNNAQSYKRQLDRSNEALQRLPEAVDKSLGNKRHVAGEDHAIDVTVRVEQETRTYTSTYSRSGPSQPVRLSTFSPPLNESLFHQPSTSSSSSQAEETPHSSSRKVVASRLTFDEIDEAEERGENLQLSSQYSPPHADHVNDEESQSPTPPPKRAKELKLKDNNHRGTAASSTTSSGREPPRPAKRKERLNDAPDLFEEPEQESLFTGDEQESSPEPKRHKTHSVTQQVEQRKLGNLQSFADWTWPAVQESIKEHSVNNPKTSAISKALHKVEACLSRKFAARLGKIEELKTLQAKRKKEVDKARKIQVERTALSERMREEERLWQKSRRTFRVNIGLHEAAIRTLAEALAP